jgi:hypothetical protein
MQGRVRFGNQECEIDVRAEEGVFKAIPMTVEADRRHVIMDDDGLAKEFESTSAYTAYGEAELFLEHRFGAKTMAD